MWYTYYYVLLFWSGPKPKTISDFWTMIWQEGVCNIVCLTNLKEGTKVRKFMLDIALSLLVMCIDNACKWFHRWILGGGHIWKEKKNYSAINHFIWIDYIWTQTFHKHCMVCNSLGDWQCQTFCFVIWITIFYFFFSSSFLFDKIIMFLFLRISVPSTGLKSTINCREGR